MQSFVVSEDDRSKRLDLFVLSQIPQLNRSFVTKLYDQNKIFVNGERVKSGYKLKINDTVSVNFDLETLGNIEKIDLPILYEDTDVIVINKPAGILTHSKGAFNPEATIATFIAPKLKGLGGERGGIVHRLDRATSGVIICAKTEEALVWLQKQFSQRKTKKSYFAVIQGVLEPKEALIDMPIERNPSNPKQFKVGSSGKNAQTHYQVTKTNNQYSLVELKPVTGRTHQLRVHLAQLKHPIVGDQLYGGAEHSRLMLHAYSLELTLPNRERKTFTATIPQEFSDIMNQ